MQRRIADIKKDIAAHSARSAWDKGVKGYAVEMFDDYVDRLHITDDSVRIGKVAETDLLNGAQNWEQYSYGGCAEVYDGDICERLCTESQKKKTRDGELPLMGEDWLTVQARALRASRQNRHPLREQEGLRWKDHGAG